MSLKKSSYPSSGALWEGRGHRPGAAPMGNMSHARHPFEANSSGKESTRKDDVVDDAHINEDKFIFFILSRKSHK